MHEWMHGHAPPAAVGKAFDTFEESLKLLDRDYSHMEERLCRMC